MRSLLGLLPASLLLAGCLGSRVASDLEQLGFEWVPIRGGVFLMGDAFEGENPDAVPVHRAEIESFEISRYETTYEQYDWYARETGRPVPMPEREDRGSRAVGGVTWSEAKAFCTYIGGRLPTEREWEYAAAGGTEKHLYPGTHVEDEKDEFVRYRENSIAESFPVGTKEPNAFGLYDMGGNVAEWVSDYYEKYPEQGEEPIYHNLETSEMRLVRGGSFSSESAVTRTYWRAGTLQSVRSEAIGFRCARG